ncbi:MAG: hypothetical protein ICV79_16260 [Flavisolibacter sp.]|nr:hypothetical protein [Flavisolibacter sp.]
MRCSCAEKYEQSRHCEHSEAISCNINTANAGDCSVTTIAQELTLIPRNDGESGNGFAMHSGATGVEFFCNEVVINQFL